MTSGRYALAHDDSLAYRGAASGLGIDVLDAFTGVRRQPASLSGGETFLASLALALGLADVVTAQSGGISLETMFIDEGFGSLDGETLETALGTLDALRSGGRTIGLISHVDTMRERLPVGLRVVVGPRGDSTILTG
nr:SbcC/MukB-like Walker B domain-containing protein [Rathayibacter agropyri]